MQLAEMNDTSRMTITTEQGSTYTAVHTSQGFRTQRTKSAHKYHETSDTGVKKPSDLTVFIDPETAREIGMWQTSSARGKRILLAANQIVLFSRNPATNQVGRDQFITQKQSYSPQPAIGLAPLELWDQDRNPPFELKPGWVLFAGSHPGSPIIKILPA